MRSCTDSRPNVEGEEIKAAVRALEKSEEDIVKERVRALFQDSDDRAAIRQYLQWLIQRDSARKDGLSVGSYIDSASGEERQVDDGSIALELLSTQ